MSGEYIALVTSLPHLPFFERATRLPITEQALGQRLRTLDETDLAQLRGAIELLRWRHHAVSTQTEQIEKQYRAVMANTTNAPLRDYVDWRIGARAALAALRLQANGQTARPLSAWGAGRLVRPIETNWDKQSVGLKALYPWLEEARQLLAKGDALSLDRLELAAVWRRLTQLGELNPFGFEYVASYAFKWDILHRWIEYEPAKATQRFQKLIEEVIGEHQFVYA